MSRQICHEHCPKGGGSGALLVLLAVIVIAAIARPVVRAAEFMLEVALITAASFLGLAAIAVAAFAALRSRRRHAKDRHVIARRTPIVLRAAETRSEPLAIEASQPSLADLEALAAEHGYHMTRLSGEDPED
jgi:hypothetical protein